MGSHRNHGSWEEQDLYSEWSTIPATEIAETNRKSVLYKLRSTINGQGVVNSVVKSLSSLTGGSVKSNGESAGHEVPFECLQSDRDVQWIMEVICYGLSLPILTTEQHEGVRDCVNIYCEWMCVMSPGIAKDKLIPFPIRDDPNRYFRLIIHHLYNVFIRRSNVTTRTLAMSNQDLNLSDITSRQAVLCHRILRTLESVCLDISSLLDSQSWDTVLTFLLAINEVLLSVPIDKDDIGTSLCERIVKSLFEIWIVACVKCFPSPSFWKTFHQLCLKIRHRSALIDNWSSVCLALTQRLVQFSDKSSVPTPQNDEKLLLLVLEMNQETVQQSWYRFLHILGNPVDIYPSSMGQRSYETSTFYSDPSNNLPHFAENFKRAMKGLSTLVNVMIGCPVTSFKTQPQPSDNANTPSPITPRRPSTARTQKSSLMTALVGKGSVAPHIPVLPPQTTITHPSQLNSESLENPFNVCRLSAFRPKVNSVLNSLGNWLFAAALQGIENQELVDDTESTSTNSSHRGSVSSISNDTFEPILNNNDRESGQAEAIGALCRLFSSKRTSEDISPVYLARFYLALQRGLSLKGSPKISVLTNILMNSTNLFQMDLNGINILIPHFLRVMEWVINEYKASVTNNNEVRRATISILLSLTCYPLHFCDLQIKGEEFRLSGSNIFLDCLTDNASVVTFRSLRPRFINLLINALRTENDSSNAQLLVIGLLTSVQDLVSRESVLQSDLSHQDRLLGSASTDTPRGLFVRALQLICHNLTSTWRNDTQFSIVALDVLSCLARIKLPPADLNSDNVMMAEMKKAASMICEYIVNQCSRPPPCHSKDMHSTIVTAFQCLAAWLQEYPDLLQDSDCLVTILEVIELGISGSKSSTGTECILKSQKIAKPVSMRVGDAAEALLTSVINHFGLLPSSSTSVDELALAKLFKLPCTNNTESFLKFFRFYSHRASIVISLLKESMGNNTAIIVRTSSGSFCWSLSSQLVPRKMSGVTKPIVVQRPQPVDHYPTRNKSHTKHFPETIERIPLTKLDLVVPSLESVVASSPKLKSEHDKLRLNFDLQTSAERQAADKVVKTRSVECVDPPPVSSIDPVRLVLSHFGFINMDDDQRIDFSPLDSQTSEFWPSLKSIDLISTRTNDTVFVYYIRRGRCDPQEILNSVSSIHYVRSEFMDFLMSLGEVVDISKHDGWTGGMPLLWKGGYPGDDFGTVGSDHGGSAFDGLQRAIYWSDTNHELAFIVPSGRYHEDDFAPADDKRGRINPERVSNDGYSVSSGEGTSISSRTYSDSSRNSHHKVKSSSVSAMAVEVLIIWLESMDDMNEVPIDSLLAINRPGFQGMLSNKEFFAIFVHPLDNGLFSINFGPSTSRSMVTLPLVDGMVVSDQVLGPFIRMTALNFFRRRRLDLESHQPPHVKRRIKIQDFDKRFKIRDPSSTDLYNSLFL